MDKQLILSKYSKSEDKLLISKMLDKIKLTQTKNSIEHIDFLDLYQQNLLQKIIYQEKIQNIFFYGGIENAERKLLIVYPEKLSNLIKENRLNFPIKCMRINLPKEMYGKYHHNNYLGGLIKLGIKREKIGDILVFEDGADILFLEDIEKFLVTNISFLTRFNKSNIEIISIKEIRKKEIKKKELNLSISSLRMDVLIAEVLNTSRKNAEELLKEGRIFLNYENIQKGTKQIKEGDILTIRGKGKYEIGMLEGTTKNGRIKIKVHQFI